MGRVIDAIIAYRLLKLLVTPFKKTKAFQLGIIDEKGKVLIKSKDFVKSFKAGNTIASARKSYTLLILQPQQLLFSKSIKITLHK